MEKCTIIRTRQELRDCITRMASAKYVAFDTETTGLNVRKDKVVGFSVSDNGKEGWYFPLYEYDRGRQELIPWRVEGVTDVRDVAVSFLQRVLLKKPLVMHNAVYDILICRHDFGVDLAPALHADTIMMAHTCNEHGYEVDGKTGFNLKLIGVALQSQLGMDVSRAADAEQKEMRESVKAAGGVATVTNTEVHKAEIDILGKYAAQDACLTYLLFDYFSEELRKGDLEKLFYDDEVMPLLREVTLEMTDMGLDVDLELLKSTETDILKDIEYYSAKVVRDITDTQYGKFYVFCKALAAYPPSTTGKWFQRACEMYASDMPKNNKGRYVNKEKEAEASLKLFDLGVEEDTRPAWWKRYLAGDTSAVPLNDALAVSRSLWKEDNKGEYFNIGSPSQLKELAFGLFSVPPLLERLNEKYKFVGYDSAKKELCHGENHPYREFIKKFLKEHRTPAFDNDAIAELKALGVEWAEDLRIYRKLTKIHGTYISRFLYGSEDGKYYFYWKQHGTISGRYASDAQQLPRPMEEGVDCEVVMKYNHLVRRFLIAGKGYKFIDADYESLEPHCFAFVSGDQGLKDIFNHGEDFYSAVAIKTEKLNEDKKNFPEGVSANKKSDVYLKKIAPVKRQKAKSYSLGIPYGMEAFALGKAIDVSEEEADNLIKGYFDGFPNLKEWYYRSRETFYRTGQIKNYFGRTAHLEHARAVLDRYPLEEFTIRGEKHKMCPLMDKKRWDDLVRGCKDAGKKAALKADKETFKKGNNECMNFQIQSLGADIVNRAAVAINRYMREHGIDGKVVMQVHDQIVTRVREDQAEEMRAVVEEIMGNIVHLEGVTLKAPAEIANNLAEGH